MKQRIISFLLVLVMALFVLPLTVLATGSLSNFSQLKVYPAGQFLDVTDQWFAADVKASFEYALVDGTSQTTFSPEKNLTIAEAIKLAAGLHEIYNTGKSTLKIGDPLWYQTYVDYALSNDILPAPYPNYTAYATRSDMAVIFANALPDEALTPINIIDDNTIPDVSAALPFSTAIYKLYRAGILTGIDASHTYKPYDLISRAETAAIVTRLANIDRKSFTMGPSELPSELPSDTPQTTNYTITAAPSAVSVATAARSITNLTVNALGFKKIIPVIGDSSVASCTWGIPSGTIFPLTIIGLSAGTTVITVSLYDSSNNVLAETTVNVTVTGGGSTSTGTYFPGYYPVPDYGLYVGTAPNYVDYDALNGSTFYTYAIADMTVDLDYAVNGYMSLLEQNGFSFSNSFINPTDGAVVYVYTNADYHLRVYLTNTIMKNIPSVIIKVYLF